MPDTLQAAREDGRREQDRVVTLVDQLRAWEQRLTAEQLLHAFEIVEASGWRRGDAIPPYVWAEAFRQVDRNCDINSLLNVRPPKDACRLRNGRGMCIWSDCAGYRTTGEMCPQAKPPKE